MASSGEPGSGAPRTVGVPTVSLPKGGGAIRGIGETFSAAPVTGTGSMSLPIVTSPGRAGDGPALALSYDSGRGNGPFGFGWALSLPAITRRTERGLPRYADAEESDVFVLSGVEDLVPVLDPQTGWLPESLVEPPHAPGYRIDRYRPRVEGLFARIERWTRLVDGDTHWRSISRDNVTTVYGADSGSRIVDPHDPTRVFSWLICRSYDATGEAIRYEYRAENGAGVDLAQAHERHRTPPDRTANRYLKSITYGNRVSRLTDPDAFDAGQIDPQWMFEVVFDYGEHHPDTPTPQDNGSWAVRDDPFSSYRAGFEVRSYRLCRRIMMFHHFRDEPGVGENCLVGSTELEYRSGDAVGAFLVAVTRRGHRRDGDGYSTRALPPVELHYSPAELREEVGEVDPGSLANAPAGLADRDVQWADLDGEGVAGILAGRPGRAGGWFYKPNLGEGRFGPAVPVAAAPSAVGAASGRSQLLDLAGDGQLDVVAFDGPTPGFYERTTSGGWTPYAAFDTLPAIEWGQPNLRFVDLDGDGHPDVMVTEEEAVTWYPSLAEGGFAAGRRVSVPLDDERGPRIVFADATQSIHLADMSGDGLTDLVRIRNGEVCYWPNLGHGRFGAKVVMDGAPWFDRTEAYDERYLRLADVDGSGVTDILYLGHQGVTVYLNRSGNSFAPGRLLRGTPRTDRRAAVATVDLFGTGTACLVWSSTQPGDEQRSLRYVDLMGGVKPHLLVRVANNLGAETVVDYAPSTRFSLADRAAGRPWQTRLAFPVHVVTRVETRDLVSRSRFVTRYAYHHGFFDGVEREFRGFGLVEQWDTEELAALGGEPEWSNVDPASHVPPTLTKTWYHTGAFTGDGAAVSRVFAEEYWREPGLTDEEYARTLLPDSVWPHAVLLPDGTYAPHEPSADELRQACRALKGSVLRQEIYALDGTEEQSRPYQVSERNHTVELLAPRAGNRYAVHVVHPRETVTYHHERKIYDGLADPRITHDAVLEVDGYGGILRIASVAYRRRYPEADLDPGLPDWARDAVHDDQTTARVTLTVNGYTNAVDTPTDYRAPLPCESRTYELVHIVPTALLRLDELRQAADLAGDGSHDLPYPDFRAAGAATDAPYRRLVEHVRTVYRRDDLSGSLPFASAEPLGLLDRAYRLALTTEVIAGTYPQLPADPAPILRDEAGYVEIDGGWWLPSLRTSYSPDPAHTTAQELAHARAHFFRPGRFTDPFGHLTAVGYDRYDLLVEEMRDAVGNVVTAGARAADGSLVQRGNDYRVLQAWLMSDPNRNRTAVAFDALGMVAASADMGKPEEQLGDSLDAIESDVDPAVLAAYLADPLADPHALLGRATTRYLVDPFAFARTAADPHPQPVVVATLARQTHEADLAPDEVTGIQQSLLYCDGLGREIQRKVLVEAGPLAPGGPVVDPRWAGTGWTVLNNKGRPVRSYEPFHTATHAFELAPVVGVSDVVCYDPVGRVVARLLPHGAYEKVVFDPWREVRWDVNDTVLLDPRTDPDVQGFLAAVLPDGWMTWHARRVGGALGAAEQAAATTTGTHGGTPTAVYADPLGRPVLSVAHNRGAAGDELHPTRVEADIEGNRRRITGPRGLLAADDFDLLQSRIRIHTAEAGATVSLLDAEGRTIRVWDDRGYEHRYTYDPLGRPLRSYVRTGDGPVRLVERTVYGEAHPDGATHNLRGRYFRQYDGAGEVTSEAHDFKGNARRTVRRLARSPGELDWTGLDPLSDVELIAAPPDADLASAGLTTETAYDALDRPVRVTSPDGTVLRPRYNQAGRLEAVDGRLPGADAGTPFVTGIDYDAKGQRTAIGYGNGVLTTYSYDPETYRLVEAVTVRGQQTVQALRYTYDPGGNIVAVRDDAQQTVFFDNAVVEPSATYAYDALYRLVEAHGREHAGQQSTWDDAGRVALPHPNDGQAMRRYTQRYEYDAAGNVVRLVHEASGGGWTRTFTYAEPNPLDPGSSSGRLSATRIGAGPDLPYTYDERGNMLSMPDLPLLSWDHENRLSAVDRGGGARVLYQYDTGGNRVRKTVVRPGGTRQAERVYVGGFEVYREFDGAGTGVTLRRETVHVTDDARRVALVETRIEGTDGGAPPRLVRYQLDNHLGSACLELDDQGALVSYEEYHPFGSTAYQAVRAQLPTPKRYRYTGKERDEETGLYCHGARYYAPWLCRWTSVDPAILAPDPGGRVDQPYVYVDNRPVIAVDPDGRVLWFVVIVAVAVTTLTVVSPANAPTSPTAPTYDRVSDAEFAGHVALNVVTGGAGTKVGGAVLRSTGSKVLAGAAGGVTAGGGTGLGGTAVSDLAHGEVSSPGTYAENIGKGALVGGALGAGFGAASRVVKGPAPKPAPRPSGGNSNRPGGGSDAKSPGATGKSNATPGAGDGEPHVGSGKGTPRKAPMNPSGRKDNCVAGVCAAIDRVENGGNTGATADTVEKQFGHTGRLRSGSNPKVATPERSLDYIARATGLPRQGFKLVEGGIEAATKQGHYAIFVGESHVVYARITPGGQLRIYDPQIARGWGSVSAWRASLGEAGSKVSIRTYFLGEQSASIPK